MQAMSLAAEDGTVENNDMRNLVQQLEANSALVGALSRQLQVGVGGPIDTGHWGELLLPPNSPQIVLDIPQGEFAA